MKHRLAAALLALLVLLSALAYCQARRLERAFWRAQAQQELLLRDALPDGAAAEEAPRPPGKTRRQTGAATAGAAAESGGRAAPGPFRGGLQQKSAVPGL